MQAILQVMMSGWMALWLGGQPGPVADRTDIKWNCQDGNWTQGPDVEDGEFHGTIEVDCEFDALGHSNFAGLRTYLVGQAVQNAQQVHSGPTAETYNGLPSTYLDVTTVASQGGNSVTIDADVHFATDEHNRFVSASLSRHVSGEGEAKNLKKIDLLTELTPAGGLHYKVHAASTMVVEKPGLVPVGIFQRKVVQAVEDGLSDQEKSLIEDIASHL